MKKFALFFFFLNFYLYVFAQDDYAIKGSVVDTAFNLKLVNTSISVLQAQDSMLYSFTRADDQGNFSFHNLKKGDYILLVTYPKYADYVQKFSLDSSRKEIDFGSLNLILMSQLLQEVVIEGRQPITIKGDTTEYDAASFKLQPNAKVEDLLKQLPGIQVDQDGKITAQGETVNKVLVDGEEFFGDDPTLVTKNIRGDMVDKVQLYDKKSDQATFTGVDDGEKTKTINIQLKEDSKQGYFGKVDASGGTQDFYQGQAMFNRFKGKEKFSVYGTIGNTGKVGLGWQDNDKYASSGGNMEFTDDGMIIMYGGGGDDLESFSGQYDGRGIPLARTGGAHYDTKFGKQSINANYKIGSLEVEGNNNTLTQNNLPTGVINSNATQDFDNYMFRHKLDGVYTAQLDSSTNLRITMDGTIKHSDTRSQNYSSSRNGENRLLNESSRTLTNEEDGKVFNANALLTKKFKKVGRTFSWNLRGSINNSEADGFLISENNFYSGTNAEPDSVQQINQYKANHIKNTSFQSNMTYSEPLFKNTSVLVNYAFSSSSGTANRQSFNQSSEGVYDQLDSLYSNNYKLNQSSNQGGVIFNYKTTKTTLNFGTKISGVRFKQLNRYTDETFTRNFTNYNPQFNYTYKFAQQKTFRLSYYGNNTQPTIDQIQPIRVNTDPLNIVLGNPDLKPSFTNRFNLSYFSYKVMTNQYVSLYGNYSFTSNPIVSNTYTDSLGRSTYQSANLNGKRPSNFSLGIWSSKKLKKLDVDVGVNLSANGNVYYNLTNGDLNRTNSYNYSGTFSISRYKQKKYDVRLSAGPSYSTSESSLQSQLNNNGWGLTANGSVNVYLPAKFQIGTDGNYQFNEATQSFNEDFKRFIWNAYITRKFLKGENLNFTMRVNDLLNQNVGFNRNAYNNMITQNSYTTIRRYFLFSVVWEFNKMGAGK